MIPVDPFLPANDPTLALAQALIRSASVTPNDAGCCTLIAERLKPLVSLEGANVHCAVRRGLVGAIVEGGKGVEVRAAQGFHSS